MTNPLDMAIDARFERASLEGASGDVDADRRRAAFQRLVREHLPVLHGLARRLGPSPEDAEDLVQETLLRAWRAGSRFRGESRLGTWLYRILVNAARDRWRRRGRRTRPERPVRGAEDPAAVLVERDALRRVLAVVDGLPRRQRECLLLRIRAALPNREIAKLLGIREGVVKLHLVHARKTLHRRFGEEVREWGIKS